MRNVRLIFLLLIMVCINPSEGFWCSSGKKKSCWYGCCKSCGTGKYQNSILHDSYSCKSCPKGRYQNQKSKSSCKSCGTGRYQNQNGQTGCKACGTGQYQSQTGKSSCNACPVAKYQGQSGKTSCNACQKGRYQGQLGKSSCNACQKGRYQDQTGKTVCKSCWAGSFQGSTGQTGCTACPKGYAQGSTGKSSCNACQKGGYQNQNGQKGCKTCGVGQYQSQTGQTGCKSCWAGSYQDEIGQTWCKGCSEGQYQSQTGKTGCTACPTGRYQEDTGQESCTECPIATYQGDTGATSVNKCKSCTAGKYNDQTGQGSCKSCPSGYTQSKTKTVCWPQCSNKVGSIKNGNCFCGEAGECNNQQYCYNDYYCSDVQNGEYLFSAIAEDNDPTKCSEQKINGKYSLPIRTFDLCEKAVNTAVYAWLKEGSSKTKDVKIKVNPATGAIATLDNVVKSSDGGGCILAGNPPKFSGKYSVNNEEFYIASKPGLCVRDILPKCVDKSRINTNACSCNHYRCEFGEYCHSENVKPILNVGRDQLTADDIPCRHYKACVGTDGKTINDGQCVCNRRTCEWGEVYCNFDKNVCSEQQNPTCTYIDGQTKNPGRCICGDITCSDSADASSGLYCTINDGKGLCTRGKECGQGTNPCLCANIFGLQNNPNCDCGTDICASGDNKCIKSLNQCSSDGEFDGNGIAYQKMFDGECYGGVEIRMYENSNDNPGTDEYSRIKACADACLNKKAPLYGSWANFGGLSSLKGFIVSVSGRCYCENIDSSSCSIYHQNTYDRYDFFSGSAPACDNNGEDNPCFCSNVVCGDENKLYCSSEKPLCEAPPVCSNTDLGVPVDKYCKCGSTTCKGGQYCDSTLSICSAFKGCGGDGYTLNADKCQCGKNSVCESGSYCLASNSLCFTQTPFPEFETCSSDNLDIVQDDCYLTGSGANCVDQNVCYTGEPCARSGINENVGHCMCSGRICTTDTGLYCQSPQYSLQYTEKHDEYCSVRLGGQIEGMVPLKQSCRQDSNCIGVEWFSEQEYGYKCEKADYLGFTAVATKSSRLLKLESSTKCSAGPVCSNTDGTAENAVGCNCGGFCM